MPKIIGWKDGEEHTCPCNGECHTSKNPCSFACIGHHNLIILGNIVQIKNAGKRPACKNCTDHLCQTEKGHCSRGYVEVINIHFPIVPTLKVLEAAQKVEANMTRGEFNRRLLTENGAKLYTIAQSLWYYGYLRFDKKLKKPVLSTVAQEYLNTFGGN